MPRVACPHCSFTRFWKLRRDRKKCKRCRRETSARPAFVVGFRATLQEWERCIQIFLRERTFMRIAEELAVSPKTAQRMAHHLRMRMTAARADIFSGPVEMDETYIGGQRKNKRLHIRRRPCKSGHGTDKLPIMGVFDRNSGHAHVEVLNRKLDIRHIIRIMQERVAAGTTVYTDGFKMYRMLPKHGFGHEWVDHAGGELARGHVHTNNIEGFWGILKRKLGCIGGIRRNRLHFFVGEIVWRFNHRTMDIQEQEKELMKLLEPG